MWLSGYLRDGFANMVAKLGGDRDKQAHGMFTFTVLDAATLEAAYRGSAMAKKIVDQPAEDCAREWREWKGNQDQIEAIEAEETRLNVPARVIAAKQGARLFGGAAIYLGVADGANPAIPINMNRVGKGSLQFLTVLTRRELRAGNLDLDPTSSNFGKPEAYYLQRPGGNEVRIHPSRLVILKGEETPSGLMKQKDEWGDSILQSVLEDVKHLDATKTNVASLIYEAKVDVIKVPNLLTDLATKGQAYEELLLTRLGLSMRAKGINGTIILDAQEEYAQKTASFAQLPEVMDRFMQFVSAAANIPMTILFGMSPAGLNATGEADIRAYYDRIRTLQKLELTPAMATLDEVLIRSATGTRDPDIHYEWRPLWQPTAKEVAEVGKLIAETVTQLKATGIISPEALGVAVVNALTEAGAMPGLEDAVEEFPYVEPDPIELGEPGGLNQPNGGMVNA